MTAISAGRSASGAESDDLGATLAQQGASLLRRRHLRTGTDKVALYRHYWPPVPPCQRQSDSLARFVAATSGERRRSLAGLRTDPSRHGPVVHGHLSSLLADAFGYRDSPVAHQPDDALEASRYSARLDLEHELFNHWLAAEPVPAVADQVAAADHLDELAAANPGVHHPLFAFLRDHATREQVEFFLRCDLIRNEVVDDEVAMLVVGLQGMQKAVVAANLWDECGRGRLEHFHTYWLRRLLEAGDDWEGVLQFRPQQPWFSKITSNVFTALLTRASRRQMAYGCFLIFESWVEPHFRAILEGMRRVGMTSPDLTIYFAAHVAVDPRHSRELSDALRVQVPRLDAFALHDVLRGAQLAVQAGTRQFDLMLDHLREPT